MAESLLQQLGEPEQTKSLAMIKSILNPLQCWQLYLLPDTSTGTSTTAVMQDGDEDAFEAEENSMESGNCNAALSKAKAEVNRATGNLYDFLVDVMSCKYLDDLREIAKGTEAIPKLLQQHMTAQSNPAESKEQSPVVSCDFVKKFAVVVKAFEHNSKSFAADSAVPAPSILTTLNKDQTSDDLKGERERVWKLVQAERRKYINFSVVKAMSTEALRTLFTSSGKVFNHSGSLNSSHRLVCASADLMVEDVKEPWLHYSKPEEKSWKSIQEFCTTTHGNSDFAMIFDGRMREVRRWNVALLTLKDL